MSLAECQTRPDSDQQQPTSTDETLCGKINSIFDSSERAVFGVDARGNIGYWNQRCEELFKFPQNISIKGKHCSDLLCGGDNLCAQKCCAVCAINNNMQSETQINNFTLAITQADGKTISVNIGTSYFYPQEQTQTCTYFSLTPAAEFD